MVAPASPAPHFQGQQGCAGIAFTHASMSDSGDEANLDAGGSKRASWTPEVRMSAGNGGAML
jgi:hypothetical protein